MIPILLVFFHFKLVEQLMMESVCRLCLAFDAPVLVLASCPLQEVYEKLTNISLNTVCKPVVACSACYWQLWKCHKLMARSLRADELLNKMLQTGALINRESISRIDRKAYKLENSLNISPMELNVFIKPEINIKEEIKDEPLSYTNDEEMENEEIVNAKNIKIEISDAIEGAEEFNDIINQRLSYEQPNIIFKEEEGGKYNKDEIEIEETKLEDCHNTCYEPEEDAAPAVKCELQLPTQDTTTLQNDFTTPETVVEDTGVKRFECAICKKRFIILSHLKLHAKVHSPVKPFQCDICHRKLRHKIGLENHLRVHTGEKPFECGICQKSYKQKTDLTKHLRTHSGEKPFECGTCKKKFNQRSTLNIHLRTHNEIKPFECAICHRDYKHKTSLIIHLRSHSGEKPFECAVCQTRFIRRCDLTVHLRRHTGEKPYQCKICKKKFNQRSTLKGHLTTH